MSIDRKLHFPCPSPDCRKRLSVSPDHAGKRSRCPHCGTKFTIPATSSLDGKGGSLSHPPPGKIARSTVSASADDVVQEAADGVLRDLRKQISKQGQEAAKFRNGLRATLFGGAGAIGGVLLSILPIVVFSKGAMSGVSHPGDDAILIGFMLTFTVIGGAVGVFAGLRTAKSAVTESPAQRTASRASGVEIGDILINSGELEEGEKTVWQTRHVKLQTILGGCFFSAVSLVFLFIALLSTDMKVIIRGTDIAIPAWVIVLVFLSSVATLIWAVGTSIGTILTITTRRTIYKTLGARTEILHTELGEIVTERDPSRGLLNGGITSITIGSTRKDGRRIVLPDLGCAEHIKSMLERIKQNLPEMKKTGVGSDPTTTG